MPMHKALKPFGWYPDGYTREALNVGDERDFGSAADGLVAEKMIAPVDVVEAPVVEPAVEEPAVEQEDEPTVEPGEVAPVEDEQPKTRRGRKPNK